MLFFRRRDISSQSHLTEQERCIHACLFFAFIILILTGALFYLAATHKGTDDQNLYYYLGAGSSLGLFLLIILCTSIHIRRFYGISVSSAHQQRIPTEFEHNTSKNSNHHV